MELPNLLLTTVYALNKSNSKRIKLGLENDGGFYHPKIKFCSSSSSLKDVTFDTTSWELLLQHKDAIMSYLREDFVIIRDPKAPMKIELPRHEIIFGTSYGKNAVMINERNIEANVITIEERTEQPTAITSKKRTLDDILRELEPSTVETQMETNKKVKGDTPPGVAMHLKTAEGFMELLDCIVLRVKSLSGHAVTVNQILKHIVEYMQEHFIGQNPDSVKKCLMSLNTFKKYYFMLKLDVESHVREKVKNECIYCDDDFIELVFAEMYAYGMFNVAKIIYNNMFPLSED